MYPRRHHRLLSPSLAAFAVACAVVEGGVDDDAHDDAEGSSGEPTEPEFACPTVTGGPTFHGDEVRGHAIWRAEDGPHVVMTTIEVRDGATLEIEPCAVVRIAGGAGIEIASGGTRVAGTLIAEGTAERPIRFEGLGGARWGHVLVHGPGAARLAHLTMHGGGGVDATGATLIARGDGTRPIQRGLLVDHLTIEDSLGAGAVVSDLAGFAEGSDALVITGSGSADHPFPLQVEVNAVGTVPAGDYTGNHTDEILVTTDRVLAEHAIMRRHGVPYRIGTSPDDRLTVGAGEDVPVSLTIEPGVTLRFHPGTGLRLEPRGAASRAAGNLVAVGTAADPITFTSAADTPAPGDWVGLWFGGITNAQTRLQHTRIEYTGADCGCELASCSDLVDFDGAVILAMPPAEVFVTDSVIAHGAGHGFVLGYDAGTTDWAKDFAANNAFDDLDGCEATLPRAASCPEPRPTCG